MIHIIIKVKKKEKIRNRYIFIRLSCHITLTEIQTNDILNKMQIASEIKLLEKAKVLLSILIQREIISM